MGRLMEVVTVSAVLASLAGCERWSLDRQMEELCRKDGGINVYERVTLPATYFDDMGRVRLGPPMPWGANKPNSESLFQRIGDDEFRLITETTYLKKGDPMKGDGVLGRTEHRLVRVRDQRVLAVAVSYGRSGGDFVVIDHYSSKSCPVPTRGTSIESAIVKGE